MTKKARRPYQTMPTSKLKEILDSAPYYTTEKGTDYGPQAHLIEAEYWHRLEVAKDKMEKNASKDYDAWEKAKKMTAKEKLLEEKQILESVKLPPGTTEFQIDNELPPLPIDTVEDIPKIPQVEDIPVIESRFDVQDLTTDQLTEMMEKKIYSINDPIAQEIWECLTERMDHERMLLKYAKAIVRQMTETLQ